MQTIQPHGMHKALRNFKKVIERDGRYLKKAGGVQWSKHCAYNRNQHASLNNKVIIVIPHFRLQHITTLCYAGAFESVLQTFYGHFFFFYNCPFLIWYSDLIEILPCVIICL